MIEVAGLKVLAGTDGWDKPPCPDEFDCWHEANREKILGCREVVKINTRAMIQKKQARFTHGVAAKPINVYLKILFLSGTEHHSMREDNSRKRYAIHPPVDRQLLTELKSLAGKDVSGPTPEASQDELKRIKDKKTFGTTCSKMGAGPLWARIDTGRLSAQSGMLPVTRVFGP